MHHCHLGGILAKLVQLKMNRVFKLKELQELIPVILRITKKSKDEVDESLNRLYSLSENGEVSEESRQLEREIDGKIIAWQKKIKMLGGLPKGMWQADFDAGDGYFCWMFPEDKIEYWHRYSENHGKRISLSDKKSNLAVANEDMGSEIGL